jgi:hypothetical protein
MAIVSPRKIAQAKAQAQRKAGPTRKPKPNPVKPNRRPSAHHMGAPVGILSMRII